MSNQAAALVDRVKELIARGEQLQQTKFSTYDRHRRAFTWVEASEFSVWMASSLAYLRRVFGEHHTHTRLFEAQCKQSTLSQTVTGTAILRSALEEIEHGYLVSLEQLVSADVFGDFLEMAAHLLSLGYKDPAASLTGAVLEDGLRRIAVARNVSVKASDDLSSLNQKLAQAGVYNRMVQNQVQVWSVIRNNADHGKFSEYAVADVSALRDGVATFLAQHLKS